MDDYDRWFAMRVLTLEEALNRYLRRAWPVGADIDDLRQEIYVRVYEACRERKPAAVNHFVFTVARNLLTDHLRRRRVVTIDLVADLTALNVLSDEVPADRALSGRQELARLERAMAELPPRCRDVFRLRKIEGCSQRETAERLGIAQGTVEKQIAKAMRILATIFLGVQPDVRAAARDEDHEHGAQDEAVR
jgi:RNA polymerase sigma-70 factor (ECF subfamily)